MPTLLDRNIRTRPNTEEAKPRRMGVEIELAGIDPSILAAQVAELLGGSIKWTSPFEILIEDTKLGEFKLELDSQLVKDIGQKSAVEGDPDDEPEGFSRTYIKTISALAINVVPWEIVSPPIEFKKLHLLYPLINRLHELGAQGTREALHFAFGVHLNPELADLGTSTIVNHLKSYFCLYDWIRVYERTDLSRRVTPYINHFEDEYISLVLHADYEPDQQQLIDDYLQYNPTRNRSLDMLPLFALLDEQQVRNKVDDDRVNARPTFHYRLPNCDIGDPKWNLNISIEMWMAVEALAYHKDLQLICDEYIQTKEKLLPTLASSWSKVMTDKLSALELLPDFVTVVEQ